MFERYVEIAQNEESSLSIPDVSKLSISDAKEMHNIILLKNVDIVLDAMEKDGVLEQIIPGLKGVVQMKDTSGKRRFKDLWWHTKLVVKQAKPKLEVRWAALFHDFGKPECFSWENGKVTFWNHEQASVKYFREFARRYRIFTKEEYQKISFLIYNLGHVEAYESSWTESAVRRFGKEMGDHLDDILLLSRADTTSSRPAVRAKIQSKISELKDRVLEVREKDAIVPPLPKGIGNAIMDLGIQGRAIGEVKSYLEKKVEEGELKAHQDIDYYMDFLHSKDRAAEKQLSRNKDAEALSSGQKSAEQLRHENSWVRPDGVRMILDKKEGSPY